jgi:hypothetical protein
MSFIKAMKKNFPILLLLLGIQFQARSYGEWNEYGLPHLLFLQGFALAIDNHHPSENAGSCGKKSLPTSSCIPDCYRDADCNLQELHFLNSAGTILATTGTSWITAGD